jgi:hypothetical protein
MKLMDFSIKTLIKTTLLSGFYLTTIILLINYDTYFNFIKPLLVFYSFLKLLLIFLLVNQIREDKNNIIFFIGLLLINIVLSIII